MNDQEKFDFKNLKREVEDLKFILARKTGMGSADVKANIINPSTVASGAISLGTGSISSAGMFAAGVVDQAAIGANAVGQSELKEEYIAVTVVAGQASGTGTCTNGSTIVGFRPTGNQDQFIDNIAVSGTTITITLAANATADNTFEVILIKT